MTSENAEKLAKVIKSCIGLGVDKVQIVDESGENLLEGRLNTSFAKFLTLIEYEGIPHG